MNILKNILQINKKKFKRDLNYINYDIFGGLLNSYPKQENTNMSLEGNKVPYLHTHLKFDTNILIINTFFALFEYTEWCLKKKQKKTEKQHTIHWLFSP